MEWNITELSEVAYRLLQIREYGACKHKECASCPFWVYPTTPNEHCALQEECGK